MLTWLRFWDILGGLKMGVLALAISMGVIAMFAAIGFMLAGPQGAFVCGGVAALCLIGPPLVLHTLANTYDDEDDD